MATNWSKLARQFLDKMKPADDKSSKAATSASSSDAAPASPSPATSSSASALTKSESTANSSTGAPTVSEGSSTTVDIVRQQIGGVYAKALLGAAGNAKSAAQVLEELAGLSNLLHEMPAFREILDSPRVSSEEKIGILDRSLKGRVSPVVLNFLKVVSEHERLDCLQYIYRETKRLHNEAQGVVEVVITTSASLDSGELSRLQKDLEKKLGAKIDVETKVDPSIIGGVVVRIGDEVYDGSVSQRLKSLRTEALARTVEKMRLETEKFALSS